MSKRRSSGAKSDSGQDTDKKILVYSASRESLEDYAATLRQIGAEFDTVLSVQDAKRMLRSNNYGVLIADVTDFESSGRRLIRWTKSHVALPGFRTHGYTRTDMPSIVKKVYCRGVDQRFLYDHSDIDRLSEMLFALFLDYPDLGWVKDMTVGQKSLRNQIGKSAAMERPVLLQGAKGLGKESLALIVHGLCNRSEHEFVILDCNPRQKFDYVYRQNLNTQANRVALRNNFELLFGVANKGTILFRSFTHLSLMAQEVLADVLESGHCISPKTGHKIAFEGRVIFTNNKSLPELVQSKKLSSRLYSRLQRTVMDIKPIARYDRETVDLAQAMVSHLCLKTRGKIMSISPAAKKLINNYPWAGNLEEMREVMEMAVSTATKLCIEPKDLLMIAPPEPEEEVEIMEDTKENIELLLKKNQGNKSKAAKGLGCSRGYLYKKMKEYKIPLDYK